MELKDQVCTLEQAKRLKELGVKADSLWKWVFPAKKEIISTTYGIYYHEQAKDIIEGNEGDEFDHTDAPAYTVAELGEILPPEYFCLFTKIGDVSGWECWHKGYLMPFPSFETEAQCRAALLIHLLENKLIKQ